MSEAVLSTGAVDAVISEFNCTLPGIEAICDSMDICQICLDAAAKKTGSLLVPYNYDEPEYRRSRFWRKCWRRIRGGAPRWN